LRNPQGYYLQDGQIRLTLEDAVAIVRASATIHETTRENLEKLEQKPKDKPG
jgi:hypothetical protein